MTKIENLTYFVDDNLFNIASSTKMFKILLSAYRCHSFFPSIELRKLGIYYMKMYG